MGSIVETTTVFTSSFQYHYQLGYATSVYSLLKCKVIQWLISANPCEAWAINLACLIILGAH